jgi:hypothetical protein
MFSFPLIWRRKKIVLIAKCLAAFFSLFITAPGCDLVKEEILPGEVPPVPAECKKESNLHTKTLDGLYRLGQVSQLQVSRAARRLHECLINSGLSDSEAKGIIKKQGKTVKERVEKEGVKKSEDFFVF